MIPDNSMAFNVDIEDFRIPEIKMRECLMISEEVEVIRDLCESPNIENDTKELLKRDMQTLKKKWDFIWNYPEKKEPAHE
jgi:hypothetical protein